MRENSEEAKGMKKTIGTAILAVVCVVVLPLAALAQDGGSGLTPPTGGGVAGSGGSVSGGSSGAGDSVAFTGGEVTGLIALAILLVAVGFTLIRATRRRALVARGQT